jgi:serine/threonine protein kinase
MKGGKLIGQGTYGCVFDPPLLCKKKQFPKGDIGKITLEEDLEREKHAFKILNSIEEIKDYLILPDASCSPRILDNQVDSDIDKCKFLSRVDPTHLKMIALEYGGKDLTKLNLKSKDSISFFTLMRHLLEAGSLIVLHGFIHYDIHAGNIVVNKNNIPKLIDFGQSFSKDEISEESIEERWKVLTPEYSAEPPEVTFLTAIDSYNAYRFEEAMTEIMPKKKVLHTIEKLLGVSVRTQLGNLATFFRTSKAFQEKDIVKIWKLYYPGFDSWAIGVVLLDMLKTLMFSYEFIESSEWKLKKAVVVDILIKMLHTNPKERIDCVEALSMLDPMNEIYLKYGVEWVDGRMKQRRVQKI